MSPRRLRNLVAFLLLVAASARAMTRGEKFDRLSVIDGLSQNEVYAILQDRQGFLWIGTDNGLNRYDGYGFLHYKHKTSDPRSLSDSKVYSLFEDRDGILWAGTVAGGLNRFDRTTEAFTRYPYDPANSNGISDGLVTRILEDSAGTLWIATYQGLDWLDRSRGIFHHVRHDPADPRSLSDNRVRALHEDRARRLWVGTENGLNLYDRASRTFRRIVYAAEPLVALRNGAVKAIHEDRRGIYWIGTRGGLFEYSLEKGPLRAFHRDAADPAALPWDDIWEIIEDPEGMLWLATNGGGLARLDPRAGRFDTFAPARDVPFSLSNARVKPLLIDRGGLLWIGTLGGGINIRNPRTAAFISHRQPAGAPPERNRVLAITGDRDGVLWVGTEGGLLRYDRRRGSEQFFTHDPDNPLSLSAPIVRAVDVDDDGRTWIGTEAGLDVIERGAKGVRRAVGGDAFLSLVADGRGSVWGGTRNGLLRYEPATGRSTRYRHDARDPKSLSADEVGSLYIDAAGTLWIGTINGLNRFDPVTERFDRFLYEEVSILEALHRNIVWIVEHDGALWLGTEGWGMVRLDLAGSEPRVTRFDVESGLISDKVGAILPDHHGNLWVTALEGIARFTAATKASKHYGEADGIPEAEFQVGAAYRAPDGELFVGGKRGFVSFIPSRIRTNDRKPTVVVTSLRLGSREMSLARGAGAIEALAFSHAEDDISFRFSALDFARPRANRFRYRLEGLDAEWVDAGTEREVTYSNLQPGEYAFVVVGSNADGVWADVPTRLPFVVRPAPWMTGWARLGYSLVVLGIVGAFVHARQRKRAERYRAELAIRNSEQRLQLALWGSGTGMWDWSRATGLLYRSHTRELLGSDAPEMSIPLDEHWSRIHEEDRPAARAAWEAHLRGETPHYDAQFRIRTDDGPWVVIHERGKGVERDASGIAMRVNGTYRDITEQKYAQDEVRLLAQAFANTTEAMVITDTAGTIREINHAFSVITGYAFHEVGAKHISTLNPSHYAPNFFSRLGEHLEEAGQWKGEVWYCRKNGEQFPAFVNVSVLRDEEEKATHFVVVFSDITERKRAEEDLRRLANYDLLTGLPNRTLFEDRMQHALDSARRGEKKIALLFVDLDRFKHINDSLGHACGDELLQAVAGRFRELLRPSDTVARLGGDEFTVLVEEIEGLSTIVQIAERLLRSLAHPFRIGGQEITITPSVGISIYPDDSSDGASLMRNADTAMYHAKSEGRNNYQFYTEEMNARVVERLVVENALRRALKENELELHYQPRIEIATGRIPSVEALVRWRHPERDLILPGSFIPIAEESGIIVELGQWVLREACRQAVRWRTMGFTDLRVAVNLSARQFRQQNLAAAIEATLVETGLDTRNLELEITETTIMSDLGQAQETLRQLKRMGLYISIDDFGTGYSALSYLKSFPVDALKIDLSFIRDMTTDPQDAAIVTAIATLAHSLGLRVIGEGVETVEQLEQLRDEGCNDVQGFLIARPLPADEMTLLLRKEFLLPEQQRVAARTTEAS